MSVSRGGGGVGDAVCVGEQNECVLLGRGTRRKATAVSAYTGVLVADGEAMRSPSKMDDLSNCTSSKLQQRTRLEREGRRKK